MTPRPLYRWKSFWLGILVLGFLGWSWVASNYQGSGVSWIMPGRTQSVSILHEASMIRVSGMFVPPTAAWKSAGFRRFATRKATPTGTATATAKVGSSTSYVPTGEWWPAPITRERKENGGWIYWNAWLAHWFVMLVFLLPWGAFLAWRWRRQRALTSIP